MCLQMTMHFTANTFFIKNAPMIKYSLKIMLNNNNISITNLLSRTDTVLLKLLFVFPVFNRSQEKTRVKKKHTVLWGEITLTCTIDGKQLTRSERAHWLNQYIDEYFPDWIRQRVWISEEKTSGESNTDAYENSFGLVWSFEMRKLI